MRNIVALVFIAILLIPGTAYAQLFGRGARARACGARAMQTPRCTTVQSPRMLADGCHNQLSSSGVATYSGSARTMPFNALQSNQVPAGMGPVVMGSTIQAAPSATGLSGPSAAGIASGAPPCNCQLGKLMPLAAGQQAANGAKSILENRPPYSLSGQVHPDTGKAIENPCEADYLACCKSGGKGCIERYLLCHLATGEPLRYTSCPGKNPIEPPPDEKSTEAGPE